MNVLIIGNKDRYGKFMPHSEFVQNINKTYIPRNYSAQEILKNAENIDAV